MSSLIKQIITNKSTRLITLIFMFIVGIVGFFLVYGYYAQIRLYEQIQYEKLSAITKTLAFNIDGDKHEQLMQMYLEKDGIKSNDQNFIYKDIHNLLRKTEKDNRTGSTIYTLIYVKDKGLFHYGVTSSDAPFFRHEYLQFPEILVKNFETGGVIPRYTSENGTWISSFSPVRNKKGEVVAVVESDVRFDEFIDRANSEIFQSSIMALGVILIVAFFLYRAVKKILRKEERMRQELMQQKQIIEIKNKDITDSINYAKKIQDAILPTAEQVDAGFKDYFVMFKPRDIVSGDFYWYHRFENGEQVVAAADCTGHGIPGALMSVIGSSLLNEIVKQRGVKDPAEILNQLDEGVNLALGNRSKSTEQRDGMDISICYINTEKDTLQFAGAFRPLIKISGGEMEEFKSDKFPIGGGDLYEKKPFSHHTIPVKEGDCFYMFSDGMPDQFGGPNGKKLMTKKFKELISQNTTLPFKEQCQALEIFFEKWKGDKEQVDDILVVGFTLNRP